MRVSVGVIAHNEEKNIRKILGDLLTQTARIHEIIVVSSGSTDRTDSIARQVAKKNGKVTLATEKKRKGKASAINQFLKRAKGELLVVSSADLRLEKKTIEELLKPFRERKTGIVASHPVPCIGKNLLLNRITKIQWRLHHEISKTRPKFGELFAFRNIIQEIPNTSVDEESIARLVMEKGFLPSYSQGAIVSNKGPETAGDFLRQRRRVYCGHLELRKSHKYQASSMSITGIINALPRAASPGEAGYLAVAALLELLGRTLGMMDYHLNKEKHYIWKIANTTKNEINSNTANI